MPFSTMFQRVSQAPTNPKTTAPARQFDVAELYRGPVQTDEAPPHDEQALDEKLRQAYFWIVNNAVISPHYDIEYNEGPAPTSSVGDSKRTLTLPSAQSYSSFILLPLLTFATRRKCLFIGGPGRGKTASAILMGVLAGSPIRDVRRAMQHGHPQMTIADLLGNPLPADLATAQSMNDIRIAWRSWLSMRVKIVDEYNRIPTRTQSALLTVMGDNYAEVPAPRAIGCSLHRIPWSRDVTSRFTSGRCGASASSLPMDAARWERCWSVSSASVSPMCR
jgi:MoxR-like ATPase